MDPVDVWRTFALAAAMFSAGLSGVSMLTVYRGEWRVIAFTYQCLMAMAAVEQAARIGNHSPPSWRLYVLSALVIIVIPSQIRAMRTGNQPRLPS